MPIRLTDSDDSETESKTEPETVAVSKRAKNEEKRKNFPVKAEKQSQREDGWGAIVEGNVLFCSNTAIENRVPFGGVEKASGALAQIYLTFGPLYEAIQASTDGKTAWVRDFQSMYQLVCNLAFQGTFFHNFHNSFDVSTIKSEF